MTGERPALRRRPSRPEPETMTDPATPLLEARAISKSFAQTRALVGAQSDTARRGHSRIARAQRRGKVDPVAGHLGPCPPRLRAKLSMAASALDVRSPREALDSGIAMVMQETSLAPDLSVLENIFLPDLGRPGRLSRLAMRRRAGEILGRSRPGARAVARSGGARSLRRPSVSSSRSPRRSRSKPI